MKVALTTHGDAGVKLTWLGHSCFVLEQDGYTILLDPYEGVEGYPPLWQTASKSGVLTMGTLDGPEDGAEPKITVHKILCSHQHHDHNAVDQAELAPESSPCPFAVRTVETWHDDQGGTLRGSNTVHILSADGLTIAHLGDLGHPLTAEQVEAIGHLDAVLIPVGGYYTIDAKTARAVCEALKPECIIPMHYRHGRYGYPVLAELEDFLSLWPENQVYRLTGPSLSLDSGLSGVVVPAFCEEN